MTVRRWLWEGTRRSLPIVLVVLGAGCSESSTGPDEPRLVSHTVDASVEWSYVALGETVTPVTVVDPAGSTEWDLGFLRTSVEVNGGANGPGGVSVHCVCQNSGASDADVMAMTEATELADFEAVDAARIPSDPGAWSADAFENHPWYRYNLDGGHQVWPTFEVYLVKRGGIVYKLQLIGYYGPAGEPRQISFRYARLAG